MKPPHICLYLAIVLILPCTSRAAVNAYDNAGNYVGMTTYNGGSGGSGFGSSWYGGSGAFLGPSGQIDTRGLSFGLTNSYINRTFGNGVPNSTSILNAGQSFYLQLQPGTVAPGGTISFSMISAYSFGTNLDLSYTAGNQNYVLTLSYPAGQAPNRSIDTGVPFSTGAMTVAYNQNSSGFTLDLTPANGTTTTLTQTNVTPQYYQFGFRTGNATMYFNNVGIPEPQTTGILAVGLLGGAGWLVQRRRAAWKIP